MAGPSTEQVVEGNDPHGDHWSVASMWIVIHKEFFKIMRNNDVRLSEFSFFLFPFLRIVFISWCN
jgi:hypothetical protein